MAEHIFERLARERGITVEKMRKLSPLGLKAVGMILPRKKRRSGEKSPALENYQHRMSGYGMR